MEDRGLTQEESEQRFLGKPLKKGCERVSGSSPLQIFPVSFLPCAYHAALPGLCLIWMEFPPPPTWHAPYSLKHF